MKSHRDKVEEAVRKNAGISFSQLKKETGLSNGVLQHHLRNSEKVQKNAGAYMEKGFCTNCELREECGEKCLRKQFRNQKNRKILQGIGQGKTQKEIARELELDRSTVNYHVQKLRKTGLIQAFSVIAEPKDIEV